MQQNKIKTTPHIITVIISSVNKEGHETSDKKGVIQRAT